MFKIISAGALLSAACLLAASSAHAVTLEDLHELLLKQQAVIEEQAKKIESLERQLDAIEGEPSAATSAPAPSATPQPPSTATQTPAPVLAPAMPVDAPPDALEASQPRDSQPSTPAVPAPPPPSQQPSADAQAAADAARKERLLAFLERFSVSSYGVMNYYDYDWDTDRDRRNDIDFEAFSLEVEYRATDTLKLEVEAEVEHLGTGSTMEFDKFEEFGEFETEIERGGEVELEELLVEYEPREWLGAKIGYFPIPFGLNYARHRPTQYFATTRFESEVALLPNLWTEAGVEVFGHVDLPRRMGVLTYRTAFVNGLDSTAFSSANWIKNGHQTRFEKINAEDWAVVARLDYEPIRGALIGASAYYGDSADNRPKPDLNVDADVTLWDVHGEYKRGLLETRASYVGGHLQNSAEVSLANRQLSNNLNVKRTPVGEDAYAAFVEVGLHFDALTGYWPEGLIPFYRYDVYDTMDEVQAPIIRNPFYERETHSGGLNYRWRDKLVLKGEYSHRRRDVVTRNEEDTVSVGVGYDFGH